MENLNIEKMQLGVYGANCYILYSKDKAIAIDIGGEPEEVEAFLEGKNLKLEKILLTHGHGDHIAGVNQIGSKYNVETYIHKDDVELLDDPSKNLSEMMPIGPLTISDYEVLVDGDTIDFEGHSVEVIHTPGHTRGCVCLKVANSLFSGDTLFKGSIGRTDLYGGGADIVRSIEEKLMDLEENIVVYPGHGPTTSIGQEKRENPFLMNKEEL